jgi:hypothetical protein
MMAAVAVIGSVVILEARPVYSYLSAQAFHTTTHPAEMALGFGLAAVLCVGATLVPITVALRKLDAVER